MREVLQNTGRTELRTIAIAALSQLTNRCLHQGAALVQYRQCNISQPSRQYNTT
jgi:hypothetical protein